MTTMPRKIVDTFYKHQVMYAITLNPIDKYQYFGSPCRLRKFRNYMHEQLLNFPGNYTLIIEYSEPRGMKTCKYTGPRLHCHGTITFRNRKDLFEYINTAYYKLLRWTSVDIDSIDNVQEWMKYCLKQEIIPNKLKFLTNITKVSLKQDPAPVK